MIQDGFRQGETRINDIQLFKIKNRREGLNRGEGGIRKADLVKSYANNGRRHLKPRHHLLHQLIPHHGRHVVDITHGVILYNISAYQIRD